MSSNPRVIPVLCFATVSAFSALAHADLFWCEGQLGPGVSVSGSDFVVCASTYGGDFNPRESMVLPDARAKESVSAGRIVVGDTALITTSASATPGYLKGTATTQILVAAPDSAPNGIAEARFHDALTIQGMPGIPLGTAVTVALRLVVSGAYSAPNADLGGSRGMGQLDGSVYLRAGDCSTALCPNLWATPAQMGGWSTPIEMQAIYLSETPTFSRTASLGKARTGDTIYVYWNVDIESQAYARKVDSVVASLFEGQLFVDILGGARAVGITGHDYGSNPSEAADAGALPDAASSPVEQAEAGAEDASSPVPTPDGGVAQVSPAPSAHATHEAAATPAGPGSGGCSMRDWAGSLPSGAALELTGTIALLAAFRRRSRRGISPVA